MTSTNADNRPLYVQVADALRRGIERGEYGPEGSIPSETQLQKDYAVSRDTVRKALAMLTHEGLIVGGQGRARTVRSYAPLQWELAKYESKDRPDDFTADAWGADIIKGGRRPTESIEVGIVIPPDRVAERLQVEVGKDLVVARRRVRYVDDIPYQIADSYFPEQIARGTLLMEPHSVSVPGGVLASIGHPQARLRDEIAIRMPTRGEAERLDLPQGTPVAEMTRTGYDADGTPLRVMVTVAPGDRNILIYELKAS